MLRLPRYTQHLASLSLSSNELGAVGTKELGGWIRSASALRKLEAANNKLDCAVLLEAISVNDALVASLELLEGKVLPGVAALDEA